MSENDHLHWSYAYNYGYLRSKVVQLVAFDVKTIVWQRGARDVYAATYSLSHVQRSYRGQSRTGEGLECLGIARWHGSRNLSS